MTRRPEDIEGGRIFSGLLIIGIAGVIFGQVGPLLEGPNINWLAASSGGVAVVSAMAAASDAARFLGQVLRNKGARMPKGLKGTARFIRSSKELKGDLVEKRWGPYWGAFKGSEIIADFESNALTLGPAGSGKGVGSIVPQILSVSTDKVVIDFKGELSAMTADTLRDRGEEVRIINLGDLFTERLGESDRYNPLTILQDSFLTPGGLPDVPADLRELAFQLYPDPPAGKSRGSDDQYWRNGSRAFIECALLIVVLIKGPRATLSDALELLADRERFSVDAAWLGGTLSQKSEDRGQAND